MRKVCLLFAAAMMVFAGVALAEFKGPGAGNTVTTVAEAKKMKDDSLVTLEGHIVKQLGDEHYTFRDDTGEIEVEIDDDEWRGQTVTPETRVRIFGEVDRDFTTVEIEAKRVDVVTGKETQAGGFQGK